MATRLVMADGTALPEEGAVLDAMKAKMGGNPVAPPEEILGSVNPVPFDSRKSRVIATLDLLVLSYSDDGFHAHEAIVMDDICNAFGFSDDEIAEMRVWAQRQAELFRECHATLED